jgi:hypothetical protein
MVGRVTKYYKTQSGWTVSVQTLDKPEAMPVLTWVDGVEFTGGLLRGQQAAEAVHGHHPHPVRQ